jgi:O-antigen ligase
MVQGRTGYLVLFCGIIYLFTIRFKRSGFLYGSAAVVLLILFLSFNPIHFNNRIIMGFSEILSWSPTQPSESSIGLRAEFIYNSFHIIYSNWLFGVGLGNISQAYGEYAGSFGFKGSSNPHNQYILFLVEAGLFGLIAFLALNYVCWKSSAKLSYFWKHATRIVLLSYGVANLFNSFLFDFSESLFFSLFMALAFSELIKLKSRQPKTIN